MNAFLAYTVFGIVTGAGYAIAASGLVVTYTTSRIFNFAHGALGMVLAFMFWELSFNRGLGTALGALLVLLVIAPLAGAVIERVMMRQLADASVGVTVVVTVALLILLIGVATTVWPPAARSVPGFFVGHGVHVFGVFVSGNDLLTIAASAAVAIGLYFFLGRTRTGVAMRAAVDNRELLALHGGRPGYVSAMSWAIGVSLAALAGILLVPTVQLDYYEMTLLLVSAIAAAVVGRLRSLPLTFAGALVLGLLQSYAVGYLPTSGLWRQTRPAIPTLFLLAALLAMPQTRLRVGQIKGVPAVPIPGVRRAVTYGLGLIALVYAFSHTMSETWQNDLSLGLVYGIVMLSLVLLTGYGGHVSLAQFSFAGIGAVVCAKWLPGSPIMLLVAAAIAGAVGAIVALTTLRLAGLYLALATLAFAVLMDKMLFQASFAFGFNNSLHAKRVHLGAIHLTSTTDYLMFITIIFVLVGWGLLWLRRGHYGRLLIAMRDSPAACNTLGVNTRWQRVLLFAASAAIAGLAGALFGGLRGDTTNLDFYWIESLLILLLAVVGGATSVTGAGIGGVVLMLLPILQSHAKNIAGLAFLIVGVAAILLGRNPNGIAEWLFMAGRKVRELFTGQPTSASGARADADSTFDLRTNEEVLSGAS